MRLTEYTQTRQALGGDCIIAIICEDSNEADKLFTKLWYEVFKFERQFSRFIPMSELSVFNRSAGIKQPISSEFRALLLATQTIGIETGGLYNPFILPALQRAGYMKSAAPGYEDDPQEDHSKKHVTTIDKLIIGDDWASIPFGTAIDIGGCGKGYLADQLGDLLKGNTSLKGFWLSLGGDIARMGNNEDQKKMDIGIQNAYNPDILSDWSVSCPMEYSAIASSGTLKRKNQAGTWHHIIDPLTLKPAVTDVRLATICANKALRADVLASCAVILGSKKAPAFLKRHGATSLLLQCIDSNNNTFFKQYGTLIRKSPTTKMSLVKQHA